MKRQKKAKTIFSILTITVLLFMLAASAFAGTGYSSGQGITVIVTRVEPAPAEPGSYATIWLKIQNMNAETIDYFSFRLDPEFPFSLDPNENPVRDIGEMSPGEQATISYKIRVDENAVEGDNPLKFLFKMFKQGREFDAELMIPVRTMDAIISVEDIRTIPEMVEPGQKVMVILSIRTNADSDLRQVNIQAGLINYISSTAGTNIVELPFTPIKSNEKTVYSLLAGEERDIIFEFVVDPDADSKPYKIPLSLDYIDSVGSNYSKSYIIGMIVGGRPDLDILIEETTITKIRSSGKLVLKIVNKGVTDVKFMNVKMEDNDKYKVMSTSSSYIGNVDSDDFENAEFTITPLKKNGGIIELPVVLEYKDANNNDYRETRVIELDLEKAKAMIPKKGSGGFVIFAIIVVVGGYLFYRRWKKRKEKKKK